MQSAEILSKDLDARMKKLDRMQNLNLGLWQGMQVSEVRHKQPKVYRQWQEQPENVCPPDGEMIEQAEQRIRTAMNKLLRRHKDGVIGLVCPSRWRASFAGTSRTTTWATCGRPSPATVAGKCWTWNRRSCPL